MTNAKAGAAIRERHEEQTPGRPAGHDSQRDVHDDAKRALGADEEIDEVHPGRGEVTGRQLRHVGHPVVAGQARARVPLPRISSKYPSACA